MHYLYEFTSVHNQPQATALMPPSCAAAPLGFTMDGQGLGSNVHSPGHCMPPTNCQGSNCDSQLLAAVCQNLLAMAAALLQLYAGMHCHSCAATATALLACTATALLACTATALLACTATALLPLPLPHPHCYCQQALLQLCRGVYLTGTRLHARSAGLVHVDSWVS